MRLRRVPIRAASEPLVEGERTLDRDATHYVWTVLRLRVGDAFTGFDAERGEESRCVILDEPAAGQLRVLASASTPDDAETRERCLVQGLAKGDKNDSIVRDATELGATRIIFVECERSVVRLRDVQRRRERQARWERIAEEAARQCGRRRTPLVYIADGWSDVWDHLPREGPRWILAPRAPQTLGEVLHECGRGSATTIAVGPEGGLTEEEQKACEVEGFVCVSLGRYILRTETAPTAALGAIAAND
jgi:16S rRNA (uracil1498-N3)-methyltransferase